MKRRSIARGIICVFSFFSVASADQPKLPNFPFVDNSRTWHGTITILREGSGYKRSESKSENPQTTSTKSRDAKATIVIEACGGSGNLRIGSVTRTISDKINEESTGQYANENCGLPEEIAEEAMKHTELYRRSHGMLPVIKTPGNSWESKEQIIRLPYEGDDCPPLKTSTDVRLVVFSNGLYQLHGGCRLWVYDLVDKVSKTKHVCSGKTSVEELHQRVGKMSDLPKRSVSTSGEGEEKRTVIHQTMPPRLQPYFFTGVGTTSGKSFSGSKPLGETKDKLTNYQEKLTASWTFRERDDCQEVYDQLLEELALGEAYSSDFLQQDSKSFDEYEDYVARTAYNALGRTPPAVKPGEDIAGTDMGVDMDCNLRYETEFRDNPCRLQVITDAIVKHEERHVCQCKNFHDDYTAANPRINGPMEVSAYIISRILLNWLKENCPDHDTASEEQRLEKLKAGRWETHPLNTHKEKNFECL